MVKVIRRRIDGEKNEFHLENGVTILNVEQLLHDAIEAFNNNEMNDGEVSPLTSILNNSLLIE